MHQARFWTKHEKGVQCQLCPHSCIISEGKTGICGIRRNSHGVLYSETYGLISAMASDPIEKKPLYHVLPGESILSIGSAGCNFKCGFCQNWSISQMIPDLNCVSPEQLINEAKQSEGIGIAYTYNEPLINFEYIYDCAKLAKKEGLLNIIVSNGYIQQLPLVELTPFIDAWNIDLKSIEDHFYKTICKGSLEPVQATIKYLAHNSFVEVTHLMVTGANDNLDLFSQLVDWLAEVSTDIPLHISRYYPQYKFDADPTDQDMIMTARQLAMKKLHWVYTGNMLTDDDSTRCPECQNILIQRQGYSVSLSQIATNQCPVCGYAVPGLFSRK